MRSRRIIYLVIVTLTLSNLAIGQSFSKDTYNISSKAAAITFARNQFQIAFGETANERLYAKLLKDSTWFVSSSPNLIEPSRKTRSIHFGGKSLKFDKATCKVIEIYRWK